MNCTGTADCTCQCCAGISVETPRGESNRAGLASIAYRTGTWASFRESMLARLSSADYPALESLKTRDSDDFSIACLDAASVMLDILTFYQERLANESYLRTATQLDSLTRLARLIGYQPSPGVSASAWLAFTIKAATGLPADPSSGTIVIPAGTQAQSVPAQGQSPQSFETAADIRAKADWNALPVQTGVPWMPARGDTSVWLTGIATQLQPGDAILIVGDERAKDSPGSTRWDLRLVDSVEPDAPSQRTRVTWKEPLGHAGSDPARKNPAFYALRQRAALFGYNAINPLMLARSTRIALYFANLLHDSPREWIFGADRATGGTLAGESLVDLDAVYAKLTPGGWLALIRPDGNTSRSPSGAVSLYRIDAITTTTRSDYGIGAKVSRVTTDTNTSLADYHADTRHASVLTQSEQLAVTGQPLDHPLYGTCIDLEGVRPDLAGIAAIALTGKSQKLMVNAGVAGLAFVPDDRSTPVPLKQGDVLTLQQPPDFLGADGSVPGWRDASLSLTLSVCDTNGRSGIVSAAPADFSLAPASAGDPVAQEVGLVTAVSVIDTPYPHTRIVLKNPLLNCYSRAATSVNANVGPATAGRSVAELLGGGSAATPNQSFTLKQAPLTYVQAANATGRLSTLSVMANGVRWTEVQSLYAAAPTAQVYSTTNLPGGTARIAFGDGVEGATLPTGVSNLQATYRVGLGAAGNVGAGTITTLVDRPLGVGGVINPMPATGGQDAQSAADIRANAPFSVLTLGRAVSITDYQNFAAAFAGIAKAFAIWIPGGPWRGVSLTVAGADGAALPPGNPTLANLVTALATHGNPRVAIFAQTFYETTFRLCADLAYDPARDAETVRAAVLAALRQTYGFASRSFGQGVSGDEIAALIQRVPGVIAVNVKKLEVVATSSAGDLASAGYSVQAYNAWMKQALTDPLPRPCMGSPMHICPYVPVARPGVPPSPAEILVLDPDPKQVMLGVLT
ncbi:putative baseplate assembly protein [Paraburkholderia sp. SIMBA_049]